MDRLEARSASKGSTDRTCPQTLTCQHYATASEENKRSFEFIDRADARRLADYPEGIESFSPGLPELVEGYPGLPDAVQWIYPERVASSALDATLSGLIARRRHVDPG